MFGEDAGGSHYVRRGGRSSCHLLGLALSPPPLITSPPLKQRHPRGYRLPQDTHYSFDILLVIGMVSVVGLFVLMFVAILSRAGAPDDEPLEDSITWFFRYWRNFFKHAGMPPITPPVTRKGDQLKAKKMPKPGKSSAQKGE